MHLMSEWDQLLSPILLNLKLDLTPLLGFSNKLVPRVWRVTTGFIGWWGPQGPKSTQIIIFLSLLRYRCVYVQPLLQVNKSFELPEEGKTSFFLKG